MASRRRTITESASAIRRAPVDRETATMAGSICGVTPTARAIEKSTESMNGRPSTTLTTRMTAVSPSVTRASSRPRRVVPCSPVGVGRSVRVLDIRPSSVCEPVRTATASPRPLTTWLPCRRALCRSASAASAGAGSGCLWRG